MSTMSNGGFESGVVLLIVVPLLGGALCMLEKGVGRLRIARMTALVTAVALVALVFVLLPAVLRGEHIVYHLGGFGGPIGIMLKMDGLGWIGAAVCAIVALAGVLFSIGEHIRDPYYYTLFLTMVGGMIGVTITDDLFTMFVLFEIIGIASYVLIAYTGKRTAVLAALRYLILSTLAMLLYLFGVFVLYRDTGLLSMSRLAAVVGEIDQRTVRLALAALITGIATRAALLPFHAWLPDAHASAPHGVSALLSGAMVKVSFVAAWRVLALFDAGLYRTIFLWLGAAMALVAVIRALAQSDAKKLLAWHTISQMGYIVAAFGAGTAGSQNAALYYMIAHALFKALLFLTVGATLFAGGERDVYRASGFMRISPVLFVLFLVGALAISGLPPLNGFAAKKLVLKSLDCGSARIVHALLWMTAIGTSASFIKLSAIFWRRSPKAETESANRRSIPLLIYVAAAILGLLCVATGIKPGFWQRLLFSLLYGNSAAVLPSVSAVYSLSGILESLVPLSLGAALYLVLRTRPGRFITTTIKNAFITLDSAAIMVVAGFVALRGLALLSL